MKTLMTVCGVCVLLFGGCGMLAVMLADPSGDAGSSEVITDFQPIVKPEVRNTASAEVQSQRLAAIEELVAADVIRSIDTPGTDPRLNVGPAFILLDEADQRRIGSLAWRYTFGLPDDAASFEEPLWMYLDGESIGHIDSGGLQLK